MYKKRKLSKNVQKSKQFKYILAFENVTKHIKTNLIILIIL